MKNSKISVIIPTYNRSCLIERAVHSVLEQDYHDMEVIIVDDCSTDNTEEVVKNLYDPRVIFIKHISNKGANAARNTGIKAATGNYIAFQDSDDEWLPKKLSKQIKAFKTATADTGVVYTACLRIEGETKTIYPSKITQKTDGFLHKELLKTNFITMPSVLVKKECLEQTGLFDETLPRFQDWELFIRLSKKYRFLFINEPLVNAFHTPGSITTNKKAQVAALVLILEKHHDEYLRHKRILASFNCNIGQQYYLTNEFTKSLQYCVKALKVWPVNPKFLLIMITFLFGKRTHTLGRDMYTKLKYIIIKASMSIR